jgi:integrase
LKSAGITLNLRRPKPPASIIRWLTDDEAVRLIEACSPHLRPLVIFMLFTGARAGEALWLDWHNVDLARAHVVFPKTKNGSPRGVPLHPAVIAELANLSYRDGAVFRRPDGKPYEPPRGDGDTSAGSRIGTAFSGALKRARIESFRVHDLRHTFATWHYRQHRDLIALQRLGGWKTLSMVTRYAHQSRAIDRDSINALPSLGTIREVEITDAEAS